MFESDWSYTRIFRVVRNNEKDLAEVKEILSHHFTTLKLIFDNEVSEYSYPFLSNFNAREFAKQCDLVNINI